MSSERRSCKTAPAMRRILSAVWLPPERGSLFLPRLAADAKRADLKSKSLRAVNGFSTSWPSTAPAASLAEDSSRDRKSSIVAKRSKPVARERSRLPVPSPRPVLDTAALSSRKLSASVRKKLTRSFISVICFALSSILLSWVAVGVPAKESAVSWNLS